MFSHIKKRDGRIVEFNINKISRAIFAAAEYIGGENKQQAIELTGVVLDYLKTTIYSGKIFSVEQIQDAVEKILIDTGHAKTAKAYILYRNRRNRIRECKSDLMDAVSEILIETSKENANISNSPSAKMLQIASVASKAYYLHRLIPEEMANAHINGDIHIHDLDFYAKTLTCIQIPLGKLLRLGFDTGHGYIRSPKRPASATALAAIILQSSQNDMHGGQSFAFFDRDMAPFMFNANENEIYQAMEALIYNLNSMHSRAGAQVPFSSLNLGCETSFAARAVTKGILLAYEKGLGHGESPIFPNIIFRIKEGINFNKSDPNYDLFRLAIRVASRRLNPTFSFMDSSFNSAYGTDIAYMGCRTRVISNINGLEQTDGRGNLSFTTVNLPRIALKAKGNIDIFFKLLDEILNLTARQLFHRYNIQAKLKVKDMPFLMGQKLYLGSENLKVDSYIQNAIKNGSLSIGFIGLAETLIGLEGKHHGEDEDAHKLGQKILSYMRKKTDEYTNYYKLNYTLLATPAEGLAGRFVKIDKEKFGIIDKITDKDYYTNSFHIPVKYNISAFEKIKIEGAFHKYTNAGHISYVELVSSPINNYEAVEDLLKHMKNCDIGYAGINFPVDFCVNCKYFGLIQDNGCPICCVPLKSTIKIKNK